MKPSAANSITCVSSAIFPIPPYADAKSVMPPGPKRRAISLRDKNSTGAPSAADGTGKELLGGTVGSK